MEARASAKHLRGSAQKARLVIDMIRGKNVNEALAVLRFTNKRAASGIEKCVRSAIANATEAAEKANVAVDPDDLWVKACFVDMGAHKNRRRVRPAPQGRAYREQRHFHHVTVLLSNDEKEKAGGGGRGKQTSKAGKPATAGESKTRKAAEGRGAPKAAAKAATKRAPKKAATENTSAEQSAE
jgi:large subunit ribosomal protein L22